MDFMAWFRDWLSRHPLKELDPSQHSRFTAEVMTRVRRLSQPQPGQAPAPWSPARWVVWPSLALAAAGLVIALTLHRPGAEPEMVRTTPQSTPLMLAEGPSDDERWLEQTLLLLEDLDESAASDGSVDEDAQLLDELEQLEQEEVATRS